MFAVNSRDVPAASDRQGAMQVRIHAAGALGGLEEPDRYIMATHLRRSASIVFTTATIARALRPGSRGCSPTGQVAVQDHISHQWRGRSGKTRTISAAFAGRVEEGNVTNEGIRSFAALLKAYRGAAGLTQEELAERSGLSVHAVSQLERGVRRNPRASTIEFLAEALKLNASERAALFASATRRMSSSELESLDAAGVEPHEAEMLIASMPTDTLPPRAPLPPGSRMPLAPNPFFVGRGNELLQVAAALKGGDTTVALGQVVAATGLGGLGKTQLAVEFVHRYGRFFAGGVFWLSFANTDEVPLQVAACAGPDAMDLAPGVESFSVEERVKRVQRAWQSAMPRLLVFDNCEEEALLDAWRPASGGCRVVVTSRRSHWTPTLGVTALPLDLLPRADSIELLRRYRPDLAANDPGLEAVATELGDLPLALHLAGSYLHTYRADVSLDGYLAEVRSSNVVQHASLLGAGLGDSPSPTGHIQGLAQTFAVCLGRLDRTGEVDRVAIGLLARMACMAPGEPVPLYLLNRTLEDIDPLRRTDGLGRLAAVGLVEEGDGWLRLHRLLVQFVQQERLDSTAQPSVERVLIDWCNDAEHGRLDGPALVETTPHLIGIASSYINNELRRAEYFNAIGLQYGSDQDAVRTWLERAFAISEWVVRSEHPGAAQILNQLAMLVSAAERGINPKRPDSGMNHGRIARLFHLRGDLVRARSFYERALLIDARVFGPNDVITAIHLQGMGEVLQDQGDLEAARPLLERALAICERRLKPDHLIIAAGLNHLAALLQKLGDPAAARPLFERALAIRERVLGPDHPDTVATRRALDELEAEGGGAGAGG
jgi:transcriptional regulator with XRE-family HTH domain/tetratricopeptide (TPR) repeat protein